MISAFPNVPLCTSLGRGGAFGNDLIRLIDGGRLIASTETNRRRGIEPSATQSFVWLPVRPASDQAGDVGSLETRVDIHDADVRGTTIEHAQQGRDPAEAGTVADARGDGHDGTGDPAPDDRGQGPFHAGDHHDRVGRVEAVFLLQQPLWPGHADIDDQVDIALHPAQRLDRLFRHWPIAGAGRHHRDRADERDLSRRRETNRPPDADCRSPPEIFAAPPRPARVRRASPGRVRCGRKPSPGWSRPPRPTSLRCRQLPESRSGGRDRDRPARRPWRTCASRCRRPSLRRPPRRSSDRRRRRGAAWIRVRAAKSVNHCGWPTCSTPGSSTIILSQAGPQWLAARHRLCRPRLAFPATKPLRREL